MSKALTLSCVGETGVIGPNIRLQSRYSTPAIEDLGIQVQAALDDDSISAVVLELGQGAVGGLADILEFDPMVADRLLALCSQIEAAPKPVIAALQGRVRGGTAALALACHYRIAAATLVMDFPEVRVGLLPSGGTTQRLPRLCGAEAAAQMLCTASSRDAQALVEIDVVDQLVDSDVIAAAVLFAQQPDLAPRPTGQRRDGLADGMRFQAEIAAQKKLASRKMNSHPVLGQIVDCIEASALLPLQAGLSMEQAALEEALTSPTARGLRHALQAEHRAIAEFQSCLTEEFTPITTVALAGIGAETAALAFAFLIADIGVTLVDTNGAALERSLGATGQLLEEMHARGAIDAETYANAVKKLEFSLEVQDLRGAELLLVGADPARPNVNIRLDPAVMVAGFGRPIAKRNDPVVMLSAPLATGTLIEVQADAACEAPVLTSLFTLGARMARLPVLGQVRNGSVLGAMTDGFMQIAEGLFAQGVTPYDIDKALNSVGFKQGIFAVLDQQGLDFHTLRRQPDTRPATIELLHAASRDGVSVGAGFYRYGGANGQGAEDADVLSLLAQMIPQIDTAAPDRPTDGEIAAIVQAGLANVGCRLLSEGAVSRASDIDAIMVHGLNVPRRLGGPMFAAEEMGHLAVRRVLLARSEATDDEFWRPDPLLEDLIKNGESFADYHHLDP